MDAATINAKIYAGRAQAAKRLGFNFNVCRPASTISPLSNVVATIPASFNAGDNTYLKPNLYGKPVWFADMDGRVTQVGDYLVAVDGAQTYFIAAMQSLLPSAVVECNAALRMSRTNDQTGQVGIRGYSGLSDAAADASDPIGQKSPFIGWPCSLQIGKGSERFTTGVASSPKTAPGWQILLPPSVPVAIHLADRLFDATGRIFDVQQAELTDLGWRIAASEVHA